MNAKAVSIALIVVALPVRGVYSQEQESASRSKASDKGDRQTVEAAASETKQTEASSPSPTNQAPPAMDKTEQASMKRVTGIGGVFIKARDPAKLRAWYKTRLGIDVQTWGGTSFRWVDAAGAPVNGKTAWFVGDGSNFAPSDAPFMINYRVVDLRGLLKLLREEGCQVLDQVDESEYGVFGWVMDPEGHKVELWQPPAGE